jgi:Flp pilus assembly protein TadD
MPTVKGRSPGQVAKLRAMVDWHLEMAAKLERSGKFNQARRHLMRANLLKPAATSPTE